MSRPSRNRSLRRLYPKDYTIGKTRVRWIHKVDLTGLVYSSFQAYVNASYIHVGSFSITGGVASLVEYLGPQNWSTMIAPFWYRCCIMGNKTTFKLIQVSNNSGANQGAIWKVAAYPALGPILLSTANQYDYAIQQSYATRKMSYNTAPNNKVTVSRYISRKKMLGFSTNKTYLDDQQSSLTSSTGNTTPNRTWYMNYAASTIGDVAAVNFVYLETTSTYYYRAWQQIEQPAAIS